FEERLEPRCDRLDAALGPFGQESGEQIDQRVRVFDPFGRRPVWRVHLLLDARAVETAIRKSVNREEVAVVLVEPLLESEQGPSVRQLARSLVAQPQPDRVGLVRADPLAYSQRVFVQRMECLEPILATMNVGAVG